MAEEKEQFEERTVTLKVTKRRLTVEEKKKFDRQLKIRRVTVPVKNFFRRIVGLTEEEPPGDCGPWYFKIRGGKTYSCRVCYQGYPTGWPQEYCLEMPT